MFRPIREKEPEELTAKELAELELLGHCEVCEEAIYDEYYHQHNVITTNAGNHYHLDCYRDCF